MSALIGFPIGATFYFDGTDITQIENSEVALEGVATESAKDNRNLLDRSDNQCLTTEALQGLKFAGTSGNASSRFLERFF